MLSKMRARRRARSTRQGVGWPFLFLFLFVVLVSFVARRSLAAGEGISPSPSPSESSIPEKSVSLGDDWGWFSDHADSRAKPTSFVARPGQPTELHNLYFSISRFSFLEETGHPSPACRSKASADKVLGLHVPIDCLPVVSARSFLRNAKVRWIDGVTLWIDFPAPERIENMGYWVDIAAEIRAYVLGASVGTRHEIKHVVVYPLFKKDVAKYPWIIDLLSVALEGVESFKVWFFQDLSKDLEHWIGIERAVRFGGWGGLKGAGGEIEGGREIGEFEGRIALPAVASLREAIWRVHGISPDPKDATLLVPVDSAGLSNSRDVVRRLHHYRHQLGVFPRPYSPTLGVPLASLAKRMAQTKLLIGRHGPLLGCAALLPPGSTVVEIMPYRYDGFDTFNLFRQITTWVGDVRHLTLAMNSTESVDYLSEDDKKYNAWLPGECYGDDCMEAMEFSGVLLDMSALNQLLETIKDGNASSMERGPRDGVGHVQYEHPPRASRIQTHAGTWYDHI